MHALQAFAAKPAMRVAARRMNVVAQAAATEVSAASLSLGGRVGGRGCLGFCLMLCLQ